MVFPLSSLKIQHKVAIIPVSTDTRIRFNIRVSTGPARRSYPRPRTGPGCICGINIEKTHQSGSVILSLRPKIRGKEERIRVHPGFTLNTTDIPSGNTPQPYSYLYSRENKIFAYFSLPRPKSVLLPPPRGHKPTPGCRTPLR